MVSVGLSMNPDRIREGFRCVSLIQATSLPTQSWRCFNTSDMSLQYPLYVADTGDPLWGEALSC